LAQSQNIRRLRRHEPAAQSNEALFDGGRGEKEGDFFGTIGSLMRILWHFFAPRRPKYRGQRALRVSELTPPLVSHTPHYSSGSAHPEYFTALRYTLLRASRRHEEYTTAMSQSPRLNETTEVMV